MDLVVVGPSEFTLGFELAGVRSVHNPPDDDALAVTMRNAMSDADVGIVVLHSDALARLPARMRLEVAESVTPTVLAIGGAEDNSLRESIRRAIGVDLWK